MVYEGSFPFYGFTKKHTGFKLYAVHVWCMRPHVKGGFLKRILVMSIPNQPPYGFQTEEEVKKFAFDTFADKRMFDEWVKEFNIYGVKILNWHRQSLKPFKWR